MMFILLLLLFIQIYTRGNNNQIQNDYKYCPLCAETLAQSLAAIEVAIETMELGTCITLCDKLPVGPDVKVACVAVCGFVGIYEFMKLVNKTDPDPIWVCQEMKVCPINDCTEDICGKITDDYYPEKITPMLHELKWELEFEEYNATGTGEMMIEMDFPGDSFPQRLELHIIQYAGIPLGKQNIAYHQLNPQTLDNGEGKMVLTLCEGWCLSAGRKPHARIIDSVKGTFRVDGYTPPAGK